MFGKNLDEVLLVIVRGTTFCYLHSSRFPLWLTTQFCIIKYWLQSKLGMAPLLVKEVIRRSEVMSTIQFDSWFMKVNNIISKFGFIRPT